MITKDDMKKILVITTIVLSFMTIASYAVYTQIKPEPLTQSLYRDYASAEEARGAEMDQAYIKAKEKESVGTAVDWVYKMAMPVLLSIIAFWLIRFVNKVDHMSRKLEAITITQAGSEASCHAMHSNIDGTLSTHSRKIDELQQATGSHSVDIATIKEHIKIQ